MAASVERSLLFPVRDAQHLLVQLDLDDLPDHLFLSGLLQAEEAPLSNWLVIAREYFAKGMLKEFEDLLSSASSAEAEERYAESRDERIAILNALGAYFTVKGKISRLRGERRDDNYITAVDQYNKAARIDQQELTTWVGKGQLQLAKQDLDSAAEMFKIALQADKDHVPSLLGQACVLFNKGKFQEALNTYKRVLRLHPGAPASVRLGIGLCHYRLQGASKQRQAFHAAKAVQAFERVIQLDPDNVEALVALGMIEINSNTTEGMKKGLERMREAYELYPYNVMALNHLANHCFFAGQHPVVEGLLEAAVLSTDHPLMKAEAYFTLARSYHSTGDYNKAATYYRVSTQEVQNPSDFILPFLGLGQIQLKLGDLRMAQGSLEKVLAVHPNSTDALKIMGCIYTQQGRMEDALAAFTKVTNLEPTNATAWIEVGSLRLSSSSFEQALTCFEKALDLLKKQGEEVPLELHNNMAVLHHQLGHLERAAEMYRAALGPGPWLRISAPRLAAGGNGGENGPAADPDAAEGGGEEDGGGVPRGKVTLVFNLALLHERLHEHGRAKALYELVLREYPGYTDCYLRLAAMAKARHDWAASMELVQEALRVRPDSRDALHMRAALEMQLDDLTQAKETLKHLATDLKDARALVALGNWNHVVSTRPSKDPNAEAIYLEKARECYFKALRENASNMYAANGIGCVLGEKGVFDMAKEIFAQVQEASMGDLTVALPDVWVNLAHVHLAKAEFPLAIRLYQNSLRRFFHGTDARVLLYLARAYYEAEQWGECRRALQRALHAAPANHALRFDAAVVMQKLATVTLRRKDLAGPGGGGRKDERSEGERTAAELRHAVSELKSAIRLFTQLMVLGEQPGQATHGFERKKLDSHMGYCKHLLQGGKLHLENAERVENAEKLKAEAERQRQAAKAAKQREEEEARAQAERARKEAEARAAAEEEEEIRRRMDSWRRQPKIGDDVDDHGGGGKAGKKGKKRRKKDEQRRREADEEEEEEFRGPAQSSEDEAVPPGHEGHGQAESPPKAAEEPPALEEPGADNVDPLAAAGLLEDSEGEEDGGAGQQVEDSGAKRRKRRAVSESEEDEGSPTQKVRREQSEDEAAAPLPEAPYAEELVGSERANGDGGGALEQEIDGGGGDAPSDRARVLRETGLDDSEED